MKGMVSSNRQNTKMKRKQPYPGFELGSPIPFVEANFKVNNRYLMPRRVEWRMLTLCQIVKGYFIPRCLGFT